MATDFRQLIAWQKAMAAAKVVYGLAPALPREETYGMRSQLTRAVVSIAANIAEGWARESLREKGHFLAIAHGSLAETETLLLLCTELGWFDADRTAPAHALLDEVKPDADRHASQEPIPLNSLFSIFSHFSFLLLSKTSVGPPLAPGTMTRTRCSGYCSSAVLPHAMAS